jgi:hypothetical protein
VASPAFYHKIERRIGREIRSFSDFIRARRGGIFVDSDQDYRNTVLISGSGRGGTTWLAEIINSDNAFRYIFEPFHPRKVSEFRHFRNRQYIRPTEQHPGFLRPASRVFSGLLRSDWSDQYNRRLICRRRIVKEIRLGLMLEWVRRQFPEMPVVLILRHPCAVAVSRVANRRPTDFEVQDVLSQPQFIEDWLTPYMPIISKLDTDFEKQIALWSIENMLPLRTITTQDALVVFYEQLCLQPEVEVERISTFLHLQSTGRMLKNIGQPSSQTRRGSSAILTGSDLIASWRSHVTPDMIAKAREILDVFGLSHLYSDEGLPLVSASHVLAH